MLRAKILLAMIEMRSCLASRLRYWLRATSAAREAGAHGRSNRPYRLHHAVRGRF